MTDEKHIAAYVHSALALHDLHLDQARETAVVEQFKLLTAMAQTYMNQTSADEEPAPIYRL